MQVTRVADVGTGLLAIEGDHDGQAYATVQPVADEARGMSAPDLLTYAGQLLDMAGVPVADPPVLYTA